MSSMSSSAVTQRIFLDLQPIVSITEKVTALNDTISSVEGFQDLDWGNNIETPTQIELLFCNPLHVTPFPMSHGANMIYQYGVLRTR
jgi:hypothetical protein